MHTEEYWKERRIALEVVDQLSQEHLDYFTTLTLGCIILMGVFLFAALIINSLFLIPAFAAILGIPFFGSKMSEWKKYFREYEAKYKNE